jgi:hypothetical protein
MIHLISALHGTADVVAWVAIAFINSGEAGLLSFAAEALLYLPH